MVCRCAAVVRLTDAWAEILKRRAGNTATGAYPAPVSELLGEMAAAGVLMQSTSSSTVRWCRCSGRPVKLAVAEVQSDLSLRATATVNGEVSSDAKLGQMVNVGGGGRCAITLDPKDRHPGQQPYQGVVPLHGDHQKLERLSGRAAALHAAVRAARHHSGAGRQMTRWRRAC